MRRKALAITLAMITAASLTACAGKDKTAEEESEKTQAQESSGKEEEQEETEETIIGICAPQEENSYWSGSAEYLQEGLEDAGFRAKVRQAASAKEQTAQVKEMAETVDALILVPIDAGAFADVLEVYGEENIPVISYNQLVTGTEAVDYYVGFDTQAAGEEVGQYIETKKELAQAQNAGEKYSIEFLLGDSQDLDTQFFYEGIMDVLRPYFESGTLQSKSERTGFLDHCVNSEGAEESKAKTSEILNQYYGEEPLDILCAQTDQMADGAAAALAEQDYSLQSTSRPWPLLTGQDLTDSALGRILEGTQGISISREYTLLDDSCVEILETYFSGDEVKVNTNRKYDNGSRIVPAQLSDVQAIDLDNYKILADMGIYSEEELTKIGE